MSNTQRRELWPLSFTICLETDLIQGFERALNLFGNSCLLSSALGVSRNQLPKVLPNRHHFFDLPNGYFQVVRGLSDHSVCGHWRPAKIETFQRLRLVAYERSRYFSISRLKMEDSFWEMDEFHEQVTWSI